MQGLRFYTRLALRNLWRNRQTYAPYLLACVLSIFTFYTLFAINVNGALNGMRSEGIVKSFTAIATVIVGIFCTVLIFYTNSFLIKRRKKELGLYSILGMEKRNIGILMFFETIFIAVAALALGLGLGMLLSRLLFLLLLRLVRFPVSVAMPVEPQALVATAGFFALVFLLTLLSNLRQVHIANPVSLMSGARQGEKEPKSSWLLTLVGLACLGGGYFIALYFKTPTEALMMFLVAVFLVIVGTYCLFTSGSIALLRALRRNKNFYYQPRHFISVSGMIYRMKQNAAGLATICILSCMVLVTVSATVSLNLSADESLTVQYPSAYSLSFDEAGDGDTLLALAEATATETGVQLADVQDYNTVSLFLNGQSEEYTLGTGIEGMAVTDIVGLGTVEEYNRSEGQSVALGAGEALVFVTGGRYDADTITLNGVPYALRHLDTLGGLPSGQADLGRRIRLFLPDAAAVQQLAGDTGPRRSIAFNLAGSEEAVARFEAAYQQAISSLSTQAYFSFLSREAAREEWYATNGGFLFLGIYFGVLFLLAAVLIVYYKQLSEGYDDAERFEILQKVGMGEQEVKKTINSQILLVFFLPLLVAVVHIAVAFWPISRAMVLFGVVNLPLLAAATGLTILAYALVYLLVYRKTAGTYFRLVRREAAA